MILLNSTLLACYLSDIKCHYLVILAIITYSLSSKTFNEINVTLEGTLA